MVEICGLCKTFLLKDGVWHTITPFDLRHYLARPLEFKWVVCPRCLKKTDEQYAQFKKTWQNKGTD